MTFFDLHKYYLSDFVDIQRKSFFSLLEKGLIEEFSKRNPITNTKKTMELFFYPEYYQLTPPEYSASQAIIKSKSYTSRLYVPVQLTVRSFFKELDSFRDFNLVTFRNTEGDVVTSLDRTGSKPNIDPTTSPNAIALPKMPGKGNVRVFSKQKSKAGEFNYDGNSVNSLSAKANQPPMRPTNSLQEKNGNLILLKWVYIGNLPLMTKRGHFILNGCARVIVNQMIRSPGIYYQKKIYENFTDKWSEKPESTFERYYADLICNRGTWLRIEIDKYNKIWAQMKRIPKIPIMWFLIAMGLSEKIILKRVMDSNMLLYNLQQDPLNPQKKILPYVKTPPEAWAAIYNLVTPKKRKKARVLNQSVDAGRVIDKSITALYSPFVITPLDKTGHKTSHQKKTLMAKTLVSNVTQKTKNRSRVVLAALKRSKSNNITLIRSQQEAKTKNMANVIKLAAVGQSNDSSLNARLLPVYSPSYRGELLQSRGVSITRSTQPLKRAVIDKNGHVPPSGKPVKTKTTSAAELGRKWIFNKFMNPRTYDLGKVGRLNFNNKLNLSIAENQTTLTPQDLLLATDYLILVSKGLRELDDIDHLKNRRVRTSGELIQLQIGIGLVRLEKSIREKMNKIDTFYDVNNNISGANLKNTGKLSISHIVNTKAFNGALKEFFGSSPLSQFMDQINPLAELTHKRRLSSMGPGGVTRDSATLEIRGIHPSHYGRICPVETPEGKNTGLVNSLTAYARVNEFGYIETPFYRVYKGQVQKKTGLFFFSAKQEEKIKLGAADLNTSEIGFLPLASIPARIVEDFTKISRNTMQYVGVAPIQMISIATSLIPFFEHDDGNRALMGSNMQRQAVPILKPQRPIVGTGLEARAVSDSGHVLQAKYSGVITYVSADKIVVLSVNRFPSL